MSRVLSTEFNSPLVDTKTGMVTKEWQRKIANAIVLDKGDYVALSAARFNGSDLGAKINAADSALGTSSGEIVVTSDAGTKISTAVTIGQNHCLRFVDGGTYTLSASITLQQGASLTGLPAGMGTASVASACVLQADASASLAQIILLSGSLATLQDITVDGNQANGGTAAGATNGNIVATAGRIRIARVTTRNGAANGLVLNGASGSKVSELMAISNVADGVLLQSASDLFLLLSEIENNASNGIEINQASAVRLVQCDIGGNGTTTGKGIYIHGTAANLSANVQIVGSQFGNNYQEDIYIVGYNSGYSAPKQTIVGNVFLGSPNRTANTYADVSIIDGNQNQIVGNLFDSNSTKYGIEFTETAGGRATASCVVGNGFLSGFGTAIYLDNVTNKDIFAGNSEGTSALGMLQGAYLPNNQFLKFQTASGSTQNLIGTDSVNAVYVDGDPTKQTINFQTNPGVTQPLALIGAHVVMSGLSAFANNAAAVTGGLSAGMLYRTGSDPDTVCVVH